MKPHLNCGHSNAQRRQNLLPWSFLYSRTIPAELTKEIDTSLQITDLETKKSWQDNFFHLRSHVWSAAVSQSLACIDSNTRFNNKVKYSNTTDSPDQIGTYNPCPFSFIQNPHTHNKITWEASRSRARCIRASSATHLDRSNYLANQKHGAIWLCLLDCSRAPPWLWKLFIFSGSQQSSSSDFTWIWLLDLIQDF